MHLSLTSGSDNTRTVLAFTLTFFFFQLFFFFSFLFRFIFSRVWGLMTSIQVELSPNQKKIIINHGSFVIYMYFISYGFRHWHNNFDLLVAVKNITFCHTMAISMSADVKIVSQQPYINPFLGRMIP